MEVKRECGACVREKECVVLVAQYGRVMAPLFV